MILAEARQKMMSNDTQDIPTHMEGLDKETSRIMLAHPEMFQDVIDISMRSILNRGFECAEGWYPLIESICRYFKHNRNRSIDLINSGGEIETINFQFPHIRFDQIKEKFGQLTIYYHICVDEFKPYVITSVNDKTIQNCVYEQFNFCDIVIGLAQSQSSRICELCGKAGEIHNNNGWLRTLCEKHKITRETV